MNREKLVEEMLRFFPLVHRRIKHRAQKGKLKGNEFFLLGSLMEVDGMPMSVYGEKLAISKPNLTKVVDELEKKGLLIREADSKDRRIINLHITNKGKKLLNVHQAHVKKTMVESIQAISDEEINELLHHFEAINNIFEQLQDDQEK